MRKPPNSQAAAFEKARLREPGSCVHARVLQTQALPALGAAKVQKLIFMPEGA